MTDDTTNCPKCGAVPCEDYGWVCGTVPADEGEGVVQSPECRRATRSERTRPASERCGGLHWKAADDGQDPNDSTHARRG